MVLRSLASLKFIQICLTKFKELKSSLLSMTMVMLNLASVKSFFNIYICDLPFDDIDIDLAIYADDTTPYTYNPENVH